MQFLRTVLPYLIGLSLVAVFVTLMSGLVSMVRGGEAGARRSNLLMRGRVATQAVAILLIAIYALIHRLG
jgi:hypothetical protein